MTVTTSVSVDQYGEWKKCCLKALGYDDFDFDDEEGIDIAGDQAQHQEPASHVTFVNLVMMAESSGEPMGIGMAEVNKDSHKKNKKNHGNDVDHWMQALYEIDAGLHRMVVWMNEKKWPYVHAATPEQEASLIQSTISSYIAMTANELESMRQMVLEQQAQQHKQQQQRQQHQAIMVQTLLEQLKEELAVPFGKLQKQRQRKAVQLWQNPLQCKLYIHGPTTRSSTLDDLDNNENNEIGEQRFLPTKPHHALQQNFLDSYYNNNNDNNPPSRPASILYTRPSKRSLGQATDTEKQTQVALRASMLAAAAAAAAAARQNPRAQQKTTGNAGRSNMPHHHHPDEDTMREQEQEEFEQEAAMLTAQLVDGNQYDAVQKMESSMVDITALLTQFSELVSSQQEDMWEIHQAATTAKENVQKGKENLVDATESTKSSKHYMASAITSMGIVLLIFHWVRY